MRERAKPNTNPHYSTVYSESNTTAVDICKQQWAVARGATLYIGVNIAKHLLALFPLFSEFLFNISPNNYNNKVDSFYELSRLAVKAIILQLEVC